MGREYKDLEEFNRDARKLAEKGWSVQSVTERTQNAGCFRCCFLGIFSSVLNPQPHIVVTHVREKAS